MLMKVISPSYSSPLPRLSLASPSPLPRLSLASPSPPSPLSISPVPVPPIDQPCTAWGRSCSDTYPGTAYFSSLSSVSSVIFHASNPFLMRTQNAERRTQNAERRTQNAERRTQNATYARQYTHRTRHVTSRHITMQTMTHRGYDSGENGDTLHISVVVSLDDTRSLQSYLPSTPIKIMLIHV